MAVTGALEAKMLLVKGTDKATAIEQATYKIKDPLTEKEWQEKKKKALNITMSGLRHRHLHKLAQTLYTLTKISTGYLGQPL